MAERDGIELRDFMRMLRRRKGALWAGLLATIALVAVAVAIMPTTYRSTATIQIERQVVPDQWISGASLGTPAERLFAINQRVMSKENLRVIAEKYPIFEPGWEENPGWLDAMRSKITVDKIDVETTDMRHGRAVLSTVAFNVSFDGPSPEVAQQVTEELVELYLKDNEVRRQQAAAVSEFLTAEAERLGAKVQEVEQKLSEFRGRHLDSLPELAVASRNEYERNLSELSQLRDAVRSLEQRRIQLNTRLSGTPRHGEVYTDQGRAYVSPLDERLSMLRTQLADALIQYTPDHPDVLRLEQQIASLEEKINQGEQSGDQRAASNPVYIQLEGELAAVESDINAQTNRIEHLQREIADYERSLSVSPEVQKQYQALVSQHESLSQMYRDVNTRLFEAQMTAQLEGEQAGDRFYLVQPPEVPLGPQNPGPLALMMFGTVLGLGSGVGVAALREYWDRSVRGRRGVLAVMNQAPLAVMPYVGSSAEDSRRKRWLLLGLLALAVIGALLLYLWRAELGLAMNDWLRANGGLWQ